jgi:hypothetical protein
LPRRAFFSPESYRLHGMTAGAWRHPSGTRAPQPHFVDTIETKAEGVPA